MWWWWCHICRILATYLCQSLPRMTLSPMTSAAKGSYGCGAQPAYNTPPHTHTHTQPNINNQMSNMHATSLDYGQRIQYTYHELVTIHVLFATIARMTRVRQILAACCLSPLMLFAPPLCSFCLALGEVFLHFLPFRRLAQVPNEVNYCTVGENVTQFARPKLGSTQRNMTQ